VRRKPTKQTILLVLGLIVGFFLYRIGQDVWSLQRAGFFEQIEKQEYQASRLDNLKALHTALTLYHDSEGQYPSAAGWMDAIEPSLNTADLKDGESKKKMIRPDLAAQPGAYGYGISSAAAGKFKDDVPEKGSAILVFESKATTRNATGEAKTEGLPKGKAVTIDGAIVEF